MADNNLTQTKGNPAANRKFGDRIRQFMKLEAAGGLILMVAACIAMGLKNSTLGGSYAAFLDLPVGLHVGTFGLEKPMFLWINDGLMAVFFFLIGMEIKREVVEGHLSDRSQVVLPGLAAVGGMVVPAALYLLFTWGDSKEMAGWAIPTATDIAFALGVLALLGNRVPVALRVFLMTLAVLDDLGAIIIIALFYTTNMSVVSLGLAAGACAVLVALNLSRVTRVAPYVIVGIVLWVCVLKSGVHATLAGVITGLLIPIKTSSKDIKAPLHGLIHGLHPWVAYGVLPLFAFANAGVALEGFNIDKLTESVPLGIMAGLVVGKPLGVFLAVLIVVKLGIGRLPTGVNLRQVFGVAALCGIGFTMSFFIGGLAFAEADVGYERADRLAIIIASLFSGTVGYLVLLTSAKKAISEGHS